MFEGLGRCKKKRIRNNMDEAEAGRDVPICSKCYEPGHTYKKCKASSYVDSTVVGSSNFVADPSAQRCDQREGTNNDGLI